MDDNLILPDEPKPTRSDAVKNRALLLETAHRLFSERGIEAVSMSAIAEAAGVGKGTLYRHFDNKAELAHVLLDEDMHDLQTRSLRRMQQQGDPVETLRWFLEQVLRFVERNEGLLCVAAREGNESILSNPAHLWWLQTIRGLLARSSLSPAADPEACANNLYIMIDIRAIQFQKHTLGYSSERILADLNTLVDVMVA